MVRAHIWQSGQSFSDGRVATGIRSLRRDSCTNTRMATRPLEPLGWANWRALLDGDPPLGAVEVGCYTDASPVGQLDRGLGPLRVINTVPGDRQLGLANMAIVLRIEVHQKLEPGRVSWSRTSVRTYTGADMG